jgi:outer membrane autotransporter protein
LTGAISTSAFLGLVADYDAHDLYLDVTRTRSFASAGSTPNQIAAASGADSLPAGSAVSAALANLPTVQAAQAAFDQLSGEMHGSVKTMTLEDSRLLREAAIGRVRSALTATHDATVWGQVFGSWGSSDSDGNAAMLDRSDTGLLIGADMPLGGWLVGVIGGYSRSTGHVMDRNSLAASDNYHVGLYAGSQWGALQLRLGAAYTRHDLDTDRAVAFAGYSDRLQAGYNAGTAQAFADLGYRMDIRDVTLEPFATLANVALTTDDFRETGGPAALSVLGGTTDATFVTLGLRGTITLTARDTAVVLHGSAGWRGAYGDVRPAAQSSFAAGSVFEVAGVPIARDALAIDVGADVTLATDISAGFAYTGQFSSHAGDSAVKANLNWKF